MEVEEHKKGGGMCEKKREKERKERDWRDRREKERKRPSFALSSHF